MLHFFARMVILKFEILYREEPDMKIFSAVLKVLAALATVAGIVYVIATYGDKIVAWAKALLRKCDYCADCDCNCDGTCTCEDDCASCACDTPCEACSAPEEEVAASEEEVVAAEADFEG